MKTTLLFSALLLPLSVAAQTVSSPNGAISVSFSLADGGRPTYEMTYKGRPVVKPSHLGLELAKDKHATKGFAETSLMDGFTESHRGAPPSTRPGSPSGARRPLSATTTTSSSSVSPRTTQDAR